MSWPMLKNGLSIYRSQHIDVDEYESLAYKFKAENYNPEEWARMAKEAGARYAVLTTKHHDGYCLFDTSTTNYSAPKTGPGRDLVKPYVEAFRNHGLKVGLYWSLIDWHDPDFATIPIRKLVASPKYAFKHDPARWNNFLVRAYEQVRELLTNYGRIDLFWFDVSGWLGADRWMSTELYSMMLNLQPHIVVNNRLPGVGDYTTPEQNIPLRAPDGWWETCMTMNNQWGYHPDPLQYKSPRRLLRTLAEIAGKGGNLLLAVGPMSDGTFPNEAVERLRTIGSWMSHSSEAIYDTVAGPDPMCFYGPMTRRDNTLYLHILDPPREEIEVRGIDGDIAGTYLLKTGEELDACKQMGRVYINLPEEKCDEYNTVVALKYKEEPHWSGL